MADELWKWCRAQRFSEPMTCRFVAAYGEMSSLLACARDEAVVKEVPLGNEVHYVRATYDYDARDDEEISLHENEVLEVIVEQPDEDAAWYTVRKGDGRTGDVPRSYVEDLAVAKAKKGVE